MILRLSDRISIRGASQWAHIGLAAALKCEIAFIIALITRAALALWCLSRDQEIAFGRPSVGSLTILSGTATVPRYKLSYNVMIMTLYLISGPGRRHVSFS